MDVSNLAASFWAWLWPLIQPSIEEMVTLACVAGVLWLRVFVQKNAAVEATKNAEADSIARKADGMRAIPGPAKKRLALAELARRLPLLAQPLTVSGAEKLVEKHFKAGTQIAKRVSVPPNNVD